MKVITFIHFYLKEKLHQWLSETRILSQFQLQKYPDMGVDLYHTVFQKDFKYLYRPFLIESNFT